MTWFMILLYPLNATPPQPHTFVENRGLEPSMRLATYMKANISQSVRDVIVIWNRSYSDPNQQIAELLTLFRHLADATELPKQLLLNKNFEIYRVLHTQKILKAVERLDRDIKKAYKALFSYSSVVIGTIDGSMQSRYKKMLSTMQSMVNSYNNLAKVTNKEYKQNYLPYYRLNTKR